MLGRRDLPYPCYAWIRHRPTAADPWRLIGYETSARAGQAGAGRRQQRRPGRRDRARGTGRAALEPEEKVVTFNRAGPEVLRSLRLCASRCHRSVLTAILTDNDGT